MNEVGKSRQRGKEAEEKKEMEESGEEEGKSPAAPASTPTLQRPVLRGKS